MSVIYEWRVEWTDEHGDIQDLDDADTLKELLGRGLTPTELRPNPSA